MKKLILRLKQFTGFLFYKQHFYKQRQTELAKTQANAKQYNKLLLFENNSHSLSALSSKSKSRRHSKNKQ